MQSISLKFRLYPTKSQIHELNETLETCKDVYNSLLNDRAYHYDTNKKTLTNFDQCKTITQWKKIHYDYQGDCRL
jgi:putative transposase